MDILARVAQAGVSSTCGWRDSGADQAAPPLLTTRLSRPVEHVLACGVDSEPLVETQRALALSMPEQILAGLAIAATLAQAAGGSVAIPADDRVLCDALERARRRFPAFPVMPVPDSYPAGEPRTLAEALLGRKIPPEARLEDVGVLLLDLQTLWWLVEAAAGRPVRERFVTLAGSVARPAVYRVPLGLPLEELVARAGGSLEPDPAFILDGPLTGARVGPDAPITASTTAVLVLPRTHALVERRQLSLEALLARARSVCAGCRICTDRCPPHLAGLALEPHRLMRGLTLGLESETEVVTGAAACTSCGICEAVCPAGLAPGRLYAAIERDLSARGLRVPPQRGDPSPVSQAELRRVTRAWLTERLGLRAYAHVGALEPEPLRSRS